MSAKVEILTYEELPIYIKIVQRAFQTGLGAVLLDGGPSPAPELTAKHLKSAQRAYRNPVNTFCKAIDPATGEITGVAKWQFFPERQTLEQLSETLKKTTPEDGAAYVALHKPATDYILDSRRDFMGTQPYVYLSTLTVDPAHHRKGAGRALIEWGTKQADELGLPTYLEASVEGHPLYERCGFKVVREVHFDMHKLGRSDIPAADINRVMIRPARIQGQMNGEKDWQVGHEYHWQPNYA